MFEKYEEPAFTVVKKDPPFEIRQYEPYWVAEVTTTGGRDDAADNAFSALFNYISGNNAPKEKMAMTIPVTQQQKPDGWAVHFIMPLNKTMASLPKPADSRITLHREERGTMLAVVFSGTSSKSNLDDHLAKLHSYAKDKQLTVKGEPLYAFYNSPFTLPFMRRNEIMFAVSTP